VAPKAPQKEYQGMLCQTRGCIKKAMAEKFRARVRRNQKFKSYFGWRATHKKKPVAGFFADSNIMLNDLS
jgi:hypothetical protein